ncbi:MAG TPA: hypothetical protein VGS07_24235 [Thermoanaerobaculia bacterium]|jgi:hypothetical protein|nr:hypothetical protein [Thermoanaerobaculia bacterium]
MSVPPAILRIAGLPGSALLPLRSPLCLESLEAKRDRLKDLAEVRARVADQIGQALPESSPKSRRFLLDVRRDCFNGRSLLRHRDLEEWAELAEISVGEASRILDLEAQVAESGKALAEVHARELDRERRWLLDSLQDQRFLRGIALGSPQLVERARDLAVAPSGAPWGRREKKLEQSLLRFVTRAATKLSPYSTLTAIALCLIREDPAFDGFAFTDGQFREISLVRANRSLLDQCQILLLRDPRFRANCRVSLNDTTQEVEPGRFRFLRNNHWTFDPEKREFRFVPAAYVSAKLEGAAIASVRALLAAGSRTYGSLISILEGEHAGGESEAGDRIHAILDGLIELKFLNLLPPWPTHEVYLERRLLEFLRTLPRDPDLQAAEDALERLLDRERQHSSSAVPERSAEAIKGALAEFRAAVASLTASEGALENGADFYEDVFLVPEQAETAEGELLRISAAKVGGLLEDAELISRFACLYNHRHDLIHTLAAFWADRWPERREIGFLELFHEAKALWTAYLRFDVTERYTNLSTFNPLGLAAIDRLGELRGALIEQAQGLMQASPQGLKLPRAKLAALLDSLPGRYRPLLGTCLFVQPADPEGSLWVLNRLFEGTGRYISRFGAIMEEPMRSRFLAHLTARSTFDLDGERADLLDLMFTYSSMVNLRTPQTRKVLELPGESVDLPRSRRVQLSDLRVQADLATESFRLVDSRGRRLLPVHMSSLNNVFLPALLRFLSIFGPFETRQVFPRAPVESLHDASVTRRLVCGNLVLKRQRWEVPVERIGPDVLDASAVDAYEKVQAWRRETGIPQSVFVYEQMHRGANAVQSFKPQFLDFSSPSFVSLFLAIAKKNEKTLFFEEPLPLFNDYPLDGASEPRAIELQIDSLTLKPTHTSAVSLSHNRGA